jgi:hypothetical protein
MRTRGRLFASVLLLLPFTSPNPQAKTASVSPKPQAKAASVSPKPQAKAEVTFERIFELKPNEGVFAYARISPSGKYLAYASEASGSSGFGLTQTETVIDVATQKVLFTEPGIDGYFSNDDERMIFLSFAERQSGVVMRHEDGRITRNVAPVMLGDYFSWSVRDGKNVILTIQSNFYELDGDHGVLPAGRVTSCPGIGVGMRPLISKDGRRISTFVGKTVVVRGLTDCNDTVDTGMQGAKADFSFDSRYVAFHVEKADHSGSEIVIIDTKDRTVRTLTGLSGSALFPSWTKDGRLCFRYDGPEYRGFMFASNVLSLPSRALAAPKPEAKAGNVAWNDLFTAPPPAHRTNVVMIWSDWSPHAPNALADLQRLGDELEASGADIGVTTVVPASTRRVDADRILGAHGIHLPEISLRPDRLHLTGALNQIPTELLFRDGVLVDERLGPQSYADLKSWLGIGR